MKKLIILILTLLLYYSVEAQTPTRRALIIGIGAYQDTGWTNAYGDNDIPIIIEMLKANKFSENDIIQLKNNQATLHGIRQSFATLLKQTQKGDIVYIHFSGHGQQIYDHDGDEADEKDESFVAYDTPKGIDCENFDYNGEYHLIDDSIYNYLTQLYNKIGINGKIIFVNDFCGSGSVDKGSSDDDESSALRRNVGPYYRWNPPSNVKRNPNPKPEFWTYIGSCKDNQNSWSVDINGHYYGVLSYALYATRYSLSSSSLNDILSKITDIIQRYSYIQTPVIRGKEDKLDHIFLFR